MSLRVAIAGLIDLLDALERDADAEPDADDEEAPDAERDWPGVNP